MPSKERAPGIRRGFPLVVLGLIVLALPISAVARLAESSQGPAGRTVFGIAEPNSWRQLLGPNSDQVATKIASIHAESQRWPISWADVEPTPPVLGNHTYSFRVFDQMYSADLAQGIRPLIVVGSAPSWATTPGAGLLADWNPPDPSNLGDFAAFCAEVARRYPAAVGIEVWNEPNYNRFWGGQQPSPTAYTDLLATAYGAIKSVDPSIAVVSAGMLPFGGNSSTAVSSSSFLSQMFQAGAGRYMDAIGAHLYPARTGAGNHRLFSPWLNEVRALALASGVQLPIWVTEVGITTTGPYGVSEAQQASALTDFFTWIQRQPDVEAFYIHTLTEPTQDNSNPEKGYALLDGSSYPYTPKPAFDAIQQAAQGAPVRGPATQTILVKSVRKWLRALPKKGKVSVSMQCSSWCMANATGKLLVLSAGGGRHRYSLTAAQTPLDEFSKGKLTFTLKPRQRAIVKQALRAGGRVRFRVTVSGRDTVVASKPQSVSARIR